MKLVRALTGVVCAAATTLALTAGVSAEPQPEPDSVIATFEGDQIRLADGWGDAQACTSDGVDTRCYRTEAEMDRAEGFNTAVLAPPMTIATSCSSSVRLYRLTGFNGQVLHLSTRYHLYNLAPYGFDNDTSSYKVGACSSYFYDGPGGGAPIYPGSTSAGSTATSMLVGWDNRVSSVYIN